MSKLAFPNTQLHGRAFVVAIVGGTAAACVQILTTVYVGATPLRIALSDAIVPVLGVAALAIFFGSQMKRPNWVVSHLDVALLLFGGWLFIACVIGWGRTGEFVAWAWGAKLLGYGVLLAYFVSGVLIAEAGEKSRNYVVLVFLATTWVIAVSSLLRFFIEINGLATFGSLALRPVGFSDNPNAFAFLVGTAIILQLLSSRALSRAPKAVQVFGLASLVAVLFLINSRSVYLGLAAAIPILFVFRAHVKWKAGMLALALAPVLVVLSSHVLPVDTPAPAGGATAEVGVRFESPLKYATRNNLVLDGGVAERLATTRLAIDLWTESPLVGIGLGGFLQHYREATGGGVFALHTSAVWLLVETGVVGLLGFATIFALFFWGVFKRARDQSDPYSAATCTLLVFAAGTSVGTEIIYQRHIWLLLGLAAAYPGAWAGVLSTSARQPNKWKA